MSNTKIVIDKAKILELIEQYETSDNPFYRGKLSQLKGILAHATEMQIDKSIEKPIDLSYSLSINQQGVSFAKLLKMDLDKYISQHEALYKYVTDQQIIEQLIVKGKCKHEPMSLENKYTHCVACGMVLQIKK